MPAAFVYDSRLPSAFGAQRSGSRRSAPAHAFAGAARDEPSGRYPPVGSARGVGSSPPGPPHAARPTVGVRLFSSRSHSAPAHGFGSARRFDGDARLGVKPRSGPYTGGKGPGALPGPASYTPTSGLIGGTQLDARRAVTPAWSFGSGAARPSEVPGARTPAPGSVSAAALGGIGAPSTRVGGRQAPAFSIGTGPRLGKGRAELGPGPAAYSPEGAFGEQHSGRRTRAPAPHMTRSSRTLARRVVGTAIGAPHVRPNLLAPLTRPAGGRAGGPSGGAGTHSPGPTHYSPHAPTHADAVGSSALPPPARPRALAASVSGVRRNARTPAHAFPREHRFGAAAASADKRAATAGPGPGVYDA